MARRSLSDIGPDIRRSLTTDVNRLVSVIMKNLPANSPQYTGFFASSWKAGTSRPRPVDRLEDFTPWSRIKKDKARDAAIPAIIRPRFTAPNFKYTDRIYIGNTAVYARYALASGAGRIQNFVQGELRYLVDFIFGDKRGPDIRIGSTPRGPADKPTGTTYIQP